MEVGTSESEPIWTEFLRKLTRRRLNGFAAMGKARCGLLADVGLHAYPRAGSELLQQLLAQIARNAPRCRLATSS